MSKMYFGYSEEAVKEIFGKSDIKCALNKRFDKRSALEQLVEISGKMNEKDKIYINDIINIG